MMTHRTLIVPLAHVPLADALCSALAGPAGSGMFITGLSATGSDPVTHYISSGVISDEMAALLPLTTVNPDGSTTTAPGDPAYVVELAAQAGITVTRAQIDALYAAIDVSDQEPFAALDRLGFKLVQTPL
jgi:hypothetical protein